LALTGLGNVAYSVGDFAEARKWHEQILAIETERGNKRGIAVALNNLGNAANMQGDLARARSYFERGIALDREEGHRHGLATKLNNLGIVLMTLEDYAVALQCYQEAQAIHQELGDQDGVIRSLINSGRALYFQKKYTEAHARQQRASALSQEMNSRELLALAHTNLGMVAIELNEPARAQQELRAALHLATQLGAVATGLYVLVGFAKLDARQNRRERALEMLTFVLDHPQLSHEVKKESEPLRTELVAALPSVVVTRIQEHSKTRTLEDNVKEILEAK
jgi:tetratricopeptide (TPR) repeat protein